MSYSLTRLLLSHSAIAALGVPGAATSESILQPWKITMGSCLHASERPWVSLSAIVARRPDAAFLLGDTIYADYGAHFGKWERPGSAANMSEAELVSRLDSAWELTTSEPHFASLLSSSIPVYAVWDDHEFVNNYDAGVETALYRIGRAAFDKHLLPSLANPTNQSGSYFNISFPRADVFFLDTRSYRDRLPSRIHGEKTDACGLSMLGMDQKRTLRKWLENVPPTKWAVVVSSGMLNDYPGDEEVDMSGDCAEVDCSSDVWYRYTEERKEIVGMVASVTPNAVFLSGDSHYAGMFKLPSNTSNSVLEVSASPLGAFSFLPPHSAVEAMSNGGDVLWIGNAVDLTRVFGEVEISHDMALTARTFAVDANGDARELFSHTQQFTYAVGEIAQG